MLRKVLRRLHVLRFLSNDLPVPDNNSRTVSISWPIAVLITLLLFIGVEHIKIKTFTKSLFCC